MKLSKEQVNALAGKIKEQLFEMKINPIKEYNLKIINSDEYKNFNENNPDCIYLSELHKSLTSMSFYHFENIQNEIKKQYFKPKLKEVERINNDAIINEIYLATIDSTDLTQLIEKVTEKFK